MSEIFGNEQTIQQLDKANNTLDSLQSKLMVTQYGTAALDVVTKKFANGSLNNVTTGFGKLTSNVDRFWKSGDKVNTLIQSATKSADLLNKSVEKTDSLLAKTSKSAATFGDILGKLSTGIFAVKGFNIIADGFGKIKNEVNQLNASLAILNKSGIDTRNLVALQAFGDAVSNLDAQNVEEFGTTFVAMYKQTTTLMSQIATQTTEQIEKYNKNIKKSVDDGRSYLEKYFDDMQDMVNNKLKNTVTSTDALRASYTGLQAGLKPGVELTNAVANSLKLMTTQGGDADQIMTLLVQTMTAYNMSASESGKIMAQLNELVNVGITDIPQLQMGFGQLAVGAASTNVKLEEMSGGLATLTLNGYSTARSFTALQNLFNQISSGDITQRLIASGAKYVENGQLVQATLDSNTVASKGFAKALEDVNKSLGGNKAKWQEIIPDMEAYGAAIALTGEKAKTLQGAIEKISKVTADNLEKAFNIKIDEDKILNFSRLVNRTSELMIKLGKLLAPVFEKGLTYIENLTSYSEVMVKNYGGVISTIVQLTLAMKVTTTALGIFIGKILALGGVIVAWRVSTNAIWGDLQKLYFAITNNSKALGGYNLLWDKNVSVLKKTSAVIGQLVGLHSLEARSIEGLSAIEGKRLSQDIKDSALRMRNDSAEIAMLDAKIARYETLKRINSENYNSLSESVFARGEIAKGKQKQLGELQLGQRADNLTIANYRGKVRNLRNDYEYEVQNIKNSTILSNSEKEEKLKKLTEKYDVDLTSLKTEVGEAAQRKKQIKRLQGESNVIEEQIRQQNKFERLSENLGNDQIRYAQKRKKLEEAITKEQDAEKKARLKNRLDSFNNAVEKRLTSINDYQMGKSAFGTLSQQEIYAGQRAIGIKNRVDKGENKYFWEPFAGLSVGGRFKKNEKSTLKMVENYDSQMLEKTWTGFTSVLTKSSNLIVNIAGTSYKLFTAAGGFFTLAAAGMFAIIGNMDSYTKKLKDIGANLSQPVKLMSTWEVIGNNLVTSFSMLKGEIQQVRKESQLMDFAFKNFANSFPAIRALVEGIKAGTGFVRERLDNYKIEAQQPLVNAVNSVIDQNQTYRNSNLNPVLSQYNAGQFQTQNVSNRNVSINGLIRKALSGGKFELQDSQDFGDAIAKMNAKSFQTKTDTTDRLNALTKDKQGLATLFGDERITNYLEKTALGKGVSKAEMTLVEGLISKLKPAVKDLIPTFERSSKEVDIYTKKLELLNKQTKLWSDALQSVSGYLNNLSKSGGEQFSAGKGLKSVIEESEKKLKNTSENFKSFLTKLSKNEDLTKLSPEELQKRIKDFDSKTLTTIKNFKSDFESGLSHLMQTSQLMLESGYTRASKEAKQFQKLINDYLKLGMVDPTTLNEVLKTWTSLKQKAFEDDISRVEKEKQMYADLYDDRYKEYYKYTLQIRKLDIESARLQIEKAKDALRTAQQDKEKDPSVIANLQRDVLIAERQKLKLERKQFDDILEESLKQIETRYQLHYFKLQNLQLEGVDTRRQITENEFQKNKELLNKQLDSLLEIQKTNNTPEIQRQIEETKYKIIQNYADKVIAEYDRVAKQQLLQQTKVQNELSRKNPLLQTEFDLLEKQLDILEKQKSVLERQSDTHISNLEQLRGFLKTYAGQREIDKQILKQKEIALQRQIESEGITLKIQKEQRDLKLEMLEIDQKIQESDAEYQAKEAALKAKKAQVEFNAGRISADDLNLAQEDANNKYLRVAGIYQRRKLIEAERASNRYQDQLDAYNSAMDIRAKQNAIKMGYAGTTISTRDDLQFAQDIVNQRPIPLPKYDGIFSQQGFNKLTTTGDKQLNVLEQIYKALSGEDNLPKYADGGVVRRKTKAIVGEAGTEAIIPMPNGRSVPVEIRIVNGQKVANSKDPKVIEAYKKFMLRNDHEFDGMSLEQLEQYWQKRGFINGYDPQFISSKHNRIPKQSFSQQKSDKRNWLDRLLFPSASAEVGIPDSVNYDSKVYGNKRSIHPTLTDDEKIKRIRDLKNKRNDEAMFVKLREEQNKAINSYNKPKLKSNDDKWLNNLFEVYSIGSKLTPINRQTKALEDNTKAVDQKFYEDNEKVLKLLENQLLENKKILQNVSKNDTVIKQGDKLNKNITDTNLKSEMLNLTSHIKEIDSQLEKIKTNSGNLKQIEKTTIETNKLIEKLITYLATPKESLKTENLVNKNLNLNPVTNKIDNIIENTIDTMLKLSNVDTSKRPNISFNSDEIDKIRPEAGGLYFHGQNKILLRSEYKDKILKGEEDYVKVLIHELRHWMQDNKLNKGWLNTKNITDPQSKDFAIKGINFSGNDRYEQDAYTFVEFYKNQILKNLNTNLTSSSFQKVVEKNRLGLNNIQPLSQRGTNSQNDKSVQMGNITINVNVGQAKDAKSTGQAVAEVVRNELYDIFNEVQVRLS